MIGAAVLRSALGNLLPVRWQVLASGFGVLIVLLVIPAASAACCYRLRDRWLRVASPAGTASAHRASADVAPGRARVTGGVRTPAATGRGRHSSRMR